MATNQADSRSAFNVQPAAGFSFSEVAHALVMPLASLRLTVALLFLAVLMTWVATLEQAYDDVHPVKMRHFSGVLVNVPVQVFFPPAWAPKLQNVPGRLYLPSGLSILVMMIVNLTAAHSLRFKIQASGTRLIAGLFALLIALVVTGVVIANGQSPGVQTEPLIPYAKMWFWMQLLMLVVGLITIGWSFYLGPKRGLERWVLVYLGAFGVIAAVVLLAASDSAYIGDSAMRILWQLAQATLAAIAGFVACVFLFKRKAGMVLLHIGIMGLMLNEIWVTLGHKEHRLIVAEGETSSEVLDIRYHEMAVVDVSDPEVDRVITIPSTKLASLEKISSAELPFDIRCVGYLRNSTLATTAASANNPATTGIGLRIPVKEVPTVAGTGNDQEVDTPAAYVELLDKKTGDSLGIHTLASQLKPKFADRVTVDGKDYYLVLRVETLQKPYQVTLNDAIREDYPGSNTPKYYGSEVTIDDASTGEITSQRIFMNNPLRYGGETFYQSGMPDPVPGQPQYSIFQVVTNIGWMIPYVCCMFTVVGLLGQFVLSLFAYLNKQIQRSNQEYIPVAEMVDVPAAEFADVDDQVGNDATKNQLPESRQSGRQAKPKSGSVLLWLPALILVGSFRNVGRDAVRQGFQRSGS